MSKRKDFPGEVEPNSFHDGTLDTDAGYFDLEYSPHDTDYGAVRVFVDGDWAIVAYQTLEEGPPAPWENNDGFGRVITKEGDESEWRSTLGLDDYDFIETEGWDDAMRLVAMKHAAEDALKPTFPEATVIKVLPDNEYDFDAGGTIIFRVKGTKLKRRYKVEWRNYPDALGTKNVHQSIVVAGQASIIGDNWDHRHEAWEGLRESGEIGDKWAILLTETSPSSTHTSFDVTGPWTSVDFDETWRYRGVWIPEDELVKDIEARKPEEQWKRAEELAKQAVETYCEWANGNCFNVSVEIFRRNTALSEDENYQWDNVLDASQMQERDCGGGVYYGSDETDEVMNEDIAGAFKILADLQAAPAS